MDTALADRIGALTIRDEHRLRRRLGDLNGRGGRQRGRGRPRETDQARAMERLLADIASAEARVATRRAALPVVRYPEELPVSQRREDLLAAIRDHQVVVVAGETGSGKTTQLPKLCLELGRGVRGTIGHTQPRRLAARTVAERIATELDTELGDVVGYQVRFTASTGPNTLVKLMTDGILLAEIQSDRLLRNYDTLIIDEAHERSLNVDFLLGYLKQLLPRRPDLKVIITSATIDPQRFAEQFGGAPVVEVSGRTYPVEVRYRPLVDPDDPTADPDRDQVQAIGDAVGELCAVGPGDILVFLSGEREIRDTQDALQQLGLRDTEVVPLYARLSIAEQHRVFAPHRGRRIVLATNVAETSLTVPGIRYVIDPGTARISRYSNRLKVQRLPIEAVSQASANQRAGRCGRTSDGICIRLYTEDDYFSRPEFTDPEILRTNLASVILQMTAADLGEVAAFPFLDPPERRHVADGVALLTELGALERTGSGPALTTLGRRLAQLPVDPRLGRMVLEAGRLGCVREVMIITAALSIQDPRERPADHRQAADAAHARFADPESDFATLLNLWNHLRERQKALSSNQFRKLCRAEFLNYLRVREWQDIVGQLRALAKPLGVTLNGVPAEPARVHQALLAGLLSHVGLRDPQTRDYLGARNARFALFPGSALFRKPPRWVMAAELVETSRLWGRRAARIDPDWIEPLAPHLVNRTYSEPHWSEERGAVLAVERVSLYGIPIVVGRTIDFGRIDPELCRELFIRHALLEGEWQTRHTFFRRNAELLAEAQELEHRARRRDIVVDPQTIFDFYDARVGAEVVSVRHFDTWWRKAGKEQPDLLTFTMDLLLTDRADEVSGRDFPDHWAPSDGPDGLRLPLSYAFEPGTETDGVSVDVPLALLNQVGGEEFAWQVPGLRAELVTALLRSLPKTLRRHFVPAPDTAAAVLARATPGMGLLDTVERELRALTGIVVPRDAWDLTKVPQYLKVTFRVIDEKGGVRAEGKDLAELRERLRPDLRAALSAASSGLTRSGMRTWELDTLPRELRKELGEHVATGYPALVDDGDSVSVRVFDDPREQAAAMRTGTRRLVLLGVPSPNKAVVRGLSNADKLVLSANPHGSVAALLADCAEAAADQLIADAGGPAWDADAFAALLAAVRTRLVPTTLRVLTLVRPVLAATTELAAALERQYGPNGAAAVADVRTQLAELVRPGFVTATGSARLPDLVRYLTAARLRLDKLVSRPARDAEWMASVHAVRREYRELAAELPATEELRAIRWMIEELRVSYFAQEIRTAHPVSEKRILRAMDAVADYVS